MAPPQPSRPASPVPSQPVVALRPRVRLSRGTTALCALSCLLALAAAGSLVLAPLVDLPLFAAASTTFRGVMGVVVSMADPGLSSLVSGLVDTGPLASPALVEAAVGLAEALDEGAVALAAGLTAGLVAVCCLLALGGAVSTAVCRRPTAALVAAELLTAMCGAVGAVGVPALDKALVRALRQGFSLPFAEAGVQLPEAVHVVAPTPWLAAIAGCALAAFVLAVWARRRTRRERSAVPARR